MRSNIRETILIVALFSGLLSGCHSRREFIDAENAGHYLGVADEIEYPRADIAPREDLMNSQRPYTLRGPQPNVEWPLTLEEAIQITLANSEVIRNAGGRVLTSGTFASSQSVSGTIPSVYDIAASDANPLTGQEAALSAFDAQLNASLRFNRNERTFNNFFFGGGVSGLRQNTSNFIGEISKFGATGTQFAMRNYTNYDRNNSPVNRFRSVYETIFEAEVRQPLLQGAGLEFNRIAGPNSAPGVYNGVVLARINTDITLANFEGAVRDLLLDVERQYWQLYFAYRDLDAKMARREALLQAWRVEQDRYEAGISKQQDEALAREQYYQARADVEGALSGSTTSGLVVGTNAGVYTTERTLRLLMGLPVNDGRLIRPADEPSTADVVFDWEDSVVQAATRRVELRRQKWNIKRREMELFASRNFLKMRLDFLGQYRFRGFGDDLLTDGTAMNVSAFEDLLRGDLQEWQMGLQLSTPIGNRIGHTAVRFAELQLSRERAIYREQELQILHDLSQAFSELDRAYSVTRSYYNRRIASYQRLQTIRAEYEANEILLRDLLDAQREATEADSTYFRGLVDYNLAVAQLHYARGSLLEYLDVYLAEGPWEPEAYGSAAKQSRRFRPRKLNYVFTRPATVSMGPYPQNANMMGHGNEMLGQPLPEGINPNQPEAVIPLEELDGPGPAGGNGRGGANDARELLPPRQNPTPDSVLRPGGEPLPLQQPLPPKTMTPRDFGPPPTEDDAPFDAINPGERLNLDEPVDPDA